MTRTAQFTIGIAYVGYAVAFLVLHAISALGGPAAGTASALLIGLAVGAPVLAFALVAPFVTRKYYGRRPL